MNTPWKWLSVSIGIGCLMIAIGILLRGHPPQGPTFAQHEELRLRLQSLELRAKVEDSGLISRIERDARAQAYAQSAYEKVNERVSEIESSGATNAAVHKLAETVDEKIATLLGWARDVDKKFEIQWEGIKKMGAMVESHDKYLRQLDKNLRK